MFILCMDAFIELEGKNEGENYEEKETDKQKGKGEIVEGVDLTKRNACDQKEAGNP